MKSDSNASTSVLSPGMIALIALCNEYCITLEQARESTRREFLFNMVRLLPRLYMAATDIKREELGLIDPDSDDGYIEQALDEDRYESVRLGIESLTGADDVYLETFEADMKYSDTPIGASLAEGLTDIFQTLYNFVSTVREATISRIPALVLSLKDEFESYWSQTLCNVMRPLNHLVYNLTDDDDDEAAVDDDA